MICVFSGPTLQPDEIRAELDAVCFPPARAGDIYKAALERPQAIGIIDGYALVYEPATRLIIAARGRRPSRHRT